MGSSRVGVWGVWWVGWGGGGGGGPDVMLMRCVYPYLITVHLIMGAVSLWT